MEYWRGFIINISSAGVVLITSNDTSPHVVTELCTSIPAETKWSILHSEDAISIFYKSDGNQIKCASNIPVPNIHFFFPSFIAESPSGVGESEILSFSLYSNESDDRIVWEADVDEFSRKHIEMQGRSSNTKERPYYKYCEKLLREANIADFSLQKSSSHPSMKDVFDEIERRLNKTLSPISLQTMVQRSVAARLFKVEEKMEKRRDAFTDIQSQIDYIEVSTQEKLKWLRNYIMDSMETLEKHSVEILTGFMNLAKNDTGIAKEAGKESKELKAQWVPMFLYVTAFIEFTCYIGFFILRMKKTNNFKKID